MRAEIAGLMPGILTDLASLVRIPSVSADESAADAMDRSAAAVAALFADTCLTEVEVVRADDGLPAVLGDRLAADVFVLADSTNWRIGVPALTTSLRGGVNVVVDVLTLEHAVHNGVYGGVVPDALTALARLLATLHDENGDVAVDGLVRGPADPLDLTEEQLRTDAGLLYGVQLIGTGPLTARMWTRP